MLAPIVTKDMKLFPSQPLPSRIKNVRSRAQSLQDFANGNAIHVSSSTAVSSNTHLVTAANASRSRNSQSIGNLPTNTVLATSFQNTQTNNAVMIIPSAKTPPKYSTSSASLRKPLDSIVEGVELSAAQGSSSAQVSVKDKNDAKIKNKKNKGLDTQSSSKIEATKKSSKPFTHRSSHDDVLSANKVNAKNDEKKSKRTQSVERERKKKESKSGGNSSSITGCFAMWLNSKFRKNGGHNDGDSSNNSSTKTTPEPLDGVGESTSK